MPQLIESLDAIISYVGPDACTGLSIIEQNEYFTLSADILRHFAAKPALLQCKLKDINLVGQTILHLVFDNGFQWLSCKDCLNEQSQSCRCASTSNSSSRC